MAASAAPRVQFAQPTSPDIHLGILTRDPTSHLNRKLGASIASRTSPARFRPARAFAVHLGEDNRNGAKLVENRHFAEAATELEPFLPPRFVCTPFRYERDGALEARTARWTECFNNASLGPKLMDNATRQDELWRRVNLRAGTKPVALQEAELNRAAATAEATRQAEARSFLLQLEPFAAAVPAAGAMQPAPL